MCSTGGSRDANKGGFRLGGKAVSGLRLDLDMGITRKCGFRQQKEKAASGLGSNTASGLSDNQGG
jgi:hypothetical protein